MPKHCEYHECNSTDSKLKYYCFPKNNSQREKWILNCSNTNLKNLEYSTLKQKYVCEKHFRNECFNNLVDKKLLPNSVPKNFEVNEVSFILFYCIKI